MVFKVNCTNSSASGTHRHDNLITGREVDGSLVVWEMCSPTLDKSVKGSKLDNESKCM